MKVDIYSKINSGEWISVKTFRSLGHKFYYTKDPHPHIHKVGSKVYIDYKALVKRREFYHRIWLETHDLYFEITEHITTSDLSKIMTWTNGGEEGSWRTYYTNEMFSTFFLDTSLLNYKIATRLWQSYRTMSLMKRRINRLWAKRIEDEQKRGV